MVLYGKNMCESQYFDLFWRRNISSLCFTVFCITRDVSDALDVG